MKYLKTTVLIMATCCFGGAAPAFAQGTAFTYQGRLNANGGPATGSYDLAFTIYDSTNLPGNVIVGPITNSATAVTNGIFTVTLDFGPGVFTGHARWLEIAVETNNGGSFTTLSPRQEITPTPYAIMATSASNLLGNLPTAQLTGTFPASQLSGPIPSPNVSGNYSNAVAFNNGADTFDGTFFGQFLGNSFMGGSFTGQFIGDGSSLINLNASQLTSGTVSAARLPANVAYLNSNQTFTAQNVFQQNTGFGTSFPAVPIDVLNGQAQIRLFTTNNDYGSVLELRNSRTNDLFTTQGAINFNNNANRYPGQIAYISIFPTTPNDDYFNFRVGGFDTSLYLEADSRGLGACSLINGYWNYFNNNNSWSDAIAGGGDSNAPNVIGSNSSYDFIGAGQGNTIGPYGSQSMIGSGYSNTVVSFSSAIVSGDKNFVGQYYSFVGSGSYNSNFANTAFIGGGFYNKVQTNAVYSVIGGGFAQTAVGPGAFIGGGGVVYNNTNGLGINGNYASGASSMIPGGIGNFAGGDFSFAAGSMASAPWEGDFVWADSQNVPFQAGNSNQFAVRASGGVIFSTSGAGVTIDGQPVLTGTVNPSQLSGSYTNAITFTNPSDVFVGNGAGLTNVNAATLQGLPANAFAPASGSANYIQNQTFNEQNASFNITGSGTFGGAVSSSSLVAGNAQITGLLRSGSESGTANPPSPAGLVIRRLNSTIAGVSNVLARTDLLTLERDGSSEGLLIRYPGGAGKQTINCLAQSFFGTNIIVHTNLNAVGTPGTIQLLSSAQHAVHAEISFGNTYNAGHMTQVVIDRYDDGPTSDYYWVGTLTSTYNQ
jgi:hypothetical protein